METKKLTLFKEMRKDFPYFIFTVVLCAALTYTIIWWLEMPIVLVDSEGTCIAVVVIEDNVESLLGQQGCENLPTKYHRKIVSP